MISCIKATIIALHLYGGGTLEIRADKITSVKSWTCTSFVDTGNRGWMGSSIRAVDTKCSLIETAGGQNEKVLDTPEEIVKMMDAK